MQVQGVNVTHTKDGLPVRIYATDGTGDFPIHGAIWADGVGWFTSKWTIKGEIIPGFQPQRDLDLDLYDWVKDIPWEYLQDWIKFVTMDANGRWSGYKETPMIRKIDWEARGFYCSLQSIKMPTASNWRESLVPRPFKRPRQQMINEEYEVLKSVKDCLETIKINNIELGYEIDWFDMIYIKQELRKLNKLLANEK